MAKRASASGMTRMEEIWGGAVLAVYLFFPPLAADPLFDLMERAFAISLDENLRDALCYYILFGLTVIAFWRWPGREARGLFAHCGRSLAAVALGLVTFYGLNELVWRFFQLIGADQVNLNDQAILAKLNASPRSTVLIVVFLAPVIEEFLFRGYVFGRLRPYGRGGAYVISCLLFSLVHVWPYFAGSWNPTYLLAMVQYLVPGAVMAWTFERAESVWGSVLLHMVVNGLAVWRAA